QLKYAAGVLSGDLCHVLRSLTTELGEVPSRLHDQRRLAALAPHRDWREVGAVRLYQNAVLRRPGGNVPDRNGVLERDDAGERKEKTELERARRERSVL